MKRKRAPLLIALAAIAVAVELVAVAGWWRWLGVVEVVATEPELGAQRLAFDASIAWPSTVWWSRHLEVRDLAPASRESVTPALHRVGALQRRWFPADFHGFNNLARASLLDNDLQGGLSLLEAAVVRDPMSPYLRRLYALALRQAGRLDEFLENLVVAEAIVPGYRHPAVDLAPEDERFVRLEGLKRRQDLYRERRISNLIALAREMRSGGDESAALVVLSDVEERPEIQLELARWSFDDGAYARCVELAGGVAGRSVLPKSLRAKAWSLVAQAADLDGDPDAARHAASESLKLAPESPAPYLALAAIAERQGEFGKALEHLRRAWGITPADVGLLVRLSRVAERAGNQNDARLALERAVKVDPSSPVLASRLVDYHVRHGDYMDATMALSAALDRFPTNARLIRQAEMLRKEIGR